MDPFSPGGTIPLIFSAVYDIYSDISEPNNLFYIFMKFLHQIGKKIHGFIHDMEATHETYFVESFNVIWKIVCRDIFSMVDYDFILEYACIKYILIIPLHHQIMTIKGPLHMTFVYSTVVH